MRSASGSPEPKTTCVLPPASGQRVQPATTSAKARSSSARVSSVTAATASAATAAAIPECAGLPGGADHRERRELAHDIRRATVGASNLHVPPNELFEVRLALHADVLVHRHRSGSLETLPDERR